MVAKKVLIDYDMQGNKVTGLGTPSASSDATPKTYVDTAIAGVTLNYSFKNSVRVATTAAGTLASSFENGDTVDGVVLATNDRILIKDQAAPAENGIYVVQASGAPVRSTDADTAAEILEAAVFVQEGTVNAEKAFVLSTNAPITLNTTGLVFVPFPGSGATLNVKEIDGTPNVSPVSIIQVTNGKLTDNGSGNVTLDLSGSPMGLQLIEEHTVPSGGEASWTSAAIAAGYRDLMILVEGRCEGAVVADELGMRFNSDSGANYDYSTAVFNNASFYARAAAATLLSIGYLTGNSATANMASRNKITVYNYDGTTFHKGVTNECGMMQGSGVGDVWTRISSGNWRSTAAITTVTFFAVGGSDIAVGSTIRIYGVK